MITVNGVEYITAEEAPTWIGVRPATVRQWGSRRKVNRYPAGGATYYAVVELAEVERTTRTGNTGRPRAAVA